MKKYNPKSIEAKWQKHWKASKLFLSSNQSKKPKKYVLVEFPYPSGDGLHMGHLRGYTAGDLMSRYYRLNGFEVMFPMGWDAFGLPAENYAIKTGIHPTITNAKNTKNFRKQMDALGLSFDWSREVDTTDPEYYKWTQWLFVQFFKAGLAYEATGMINWCPKDKTGLANEEVIAGKCDRCGTPVEKKELRQWYLKITAYAEKLLEGLKQLPDWTDPVKIAQENWIGKSTGAEIGFPIAGSDQKIKVFTTRPDTIFGATYCVLAPEHPLVSQLGSYISNLDEVQKYIKASESKPEEERVAEGKDKTGVELKGVKAINPATKQEIPVWVADYVLGNYGTGAIMAVPAHDERDFEFAKKFKLPVVQVIKPKSAMQNPLESKVVSAGAYGHLSNDMQFDCWIGDGLLINSGSYTGKDSETARQQMAEEFGKSSIKYKLRDWVFSRQRYWGEPIPIIHCPKCGTVAVPDEDLPVVLPKVKKYEPTGTGESPLAGIDSWVNVKCPNCQGPAKRETNTMPQWAGSSWYFLRYTDPQNAKEFASPEALKHWMPVDIYFGGFEHTTLHLLYSRFWNLFFYDQKLVPVKEPYTKRVPHGIVLAANGEKMSKSKGNVISPDPIVKQHGADTVRMFELFLGPHDAMVAWKDDGMIGVRRFLERVWVWANNQEAEIRKSKIESRDSELVRKQLHRLIKKITYDIDHLSFNTTISGFMEFYNTVKDETISLESIKTFLILLYPMAPHIAEELNEIIGGEKSLQFETWPKFDPKLLVDDEVQVIVQVNGKVRDRITVSPHASENEVTEASLRSDKIKTALAGKGIKKIIYVPGKIINIVL